MEVNWFNLIFSSVLLGIGLAMDAFSVSLANGLNEPKMRLKKVFSIAAIFAVFQALMPLIGWVAISGFLELFNKFKLGHKSLPYIFPRRIVSILKLVSRCTMSTEVRRMVSHRSYQKSISSWVF